MSYTKEILSMSTAERLLHFSTKTESCWNWIGTVKRDGYGVVWNGVKQERAHRVAYKTFIGDFDAALYVCHKCDNPLCINPEHLFLGTHADNIRDRNSKGRAPRMDGEHHPRATISNQQALEIRTSSDSVPILCSRYGINPGVIRNIKSGASWKHLKTGEPA